MSLIAKMNEEELDNDFNEALAKEDELGMAIKAHLDIEYWANQLFELMLPHPEFIKPMELDYSGKINLLCSLGLNKEYKKPLIYMGTVRNKFAHNLKYTIDKEIAKKVYESTERSENKKYTTFRQMEPKAQFIFLAVIVRNMIKAAVYVARK